METTFKGETVSRKKVIQEIEQFDRDYPDSNDYDAWLDSQNYRYALQYGDRLYPCKYILSQATGLHIRSFSGGEQTNRVFRDLGFEIVNK